MSLTGILDSSHCPTGTGTPSWIDNTLLTRCPWRPINLIIETFVLHLSYIWVNVDFVLYFLEKRPINPITFSQKILIFLFWIIPEFV